MEALLEKMIGNSVAVGGVILLVLGARLLLKKAPRSFSYALWFLVLIRILCPVTIQGIYTLLPEQVGNHAGSTVAMLQERQAEWMNQKLIFPERQMQTTEELENEDVLSSAEETGGSVKDDAEPFVWNLRARKTEENAFLSNLSLYDVFGIVWLAGFACLSLYLAVNMLLAHRRLRDAIPIGNNIYISDAVANSLVCGLFRPHIYVNPNICRAKNMDCILAHEGYHIRRLDYIVKPLAFLIFSLNWFNPLVWVAYWLMMKDMEMSCDEAVMKKMGVSAKKEYSYLLLTMAQKEERRFQQTPAFGGLIVKQRIRNVLSYKRPAALTLVISVLIIGICGCGVFSSPEKAGNDTKIPDRADKEPHYVEKKLPVKCSEDGAPDITRNSAYSINYEQLQDMEGNIYFFSEMLTEKGKTLYELSQSAVKLEGEAVKSVALPWAEEVTEYTNKKAMYLQNRFFGRDGKLYLNYIIYSRRMRSNETDKSMESLYITDTCLIRVDMKTNEWKEISLPKIPDSQDGEGIVPPSISVLRSGNIIVTNFRNICGIYSPEGKKLRDLDKGKYYLPGDGEYLAITYEDKTSKSIEFYNEETGERTNQIMLADVQKGLSDTEIVIPTYNEGNIYIICSRGIYKAEAGEKEFTCVVDPVRDKTFTLGNSDNIPRCLFVDEENEEFYAVFYSESISTREEYICSYKKQ